MTDFPTDEAMMRALKARLGRRTVLRGTGALGVGALGASLLAACGTEGAQKTESEQAATEDLSDKEKVVNFSNWPFYIDVDEKDESKHPSLDRFQALSKGVKVNYTEDINDNDQFFGKIRADLAAGNDIKRDIIVLTDWMASRLIRLRWVQKMDHANIPNLRNLAPPLQNVDFDPQRDYTIPWQSGATGIAYNEKVTKPVTTIEQLFTDPALKGKVTALTEMRDTMGLILLQQGKNTVRFSDADFDAAIAYLDKAVKSGQIRKFTGNDYTSDLAAGNIAACIAWSGDVVQLQADNPSIKFVVPEAGAMLWSDNAMIPNKAAHKKNAEQLLNFYYDPVNAAKLAIAVNYVCPVAGAQEEVAKVDPEVAKNPLVFPTDETMKRLNVFKGLDEKEEREYSDKFQKVTGV